MSSDGHHTPVSSDDLNVTEGRAGKGFLTASNVLSISRALLVIPFVMVMFSSAPWKDAAGVIIMVLAAVTDKMDGVLARKYGEITEWGKILDPLADKIAIAAVGLVLLLLGRIPLWYVASVLARDLLILGAGIYLKSSRGMVLPSNQVGKWSVGVITIALFFALVQTGSPWLEIAMVASLVMLGVSLFQYTLRFIEVVRR